MRPTASLCHPIVRAAAAGIIVALLACGVLTGLARLGAAVPAHAASKLAWHGVLMIPVFFGAVIGIERAVALGERRAYLVPAAAVAAGIALLAGAPPALSATLLVGAASVALVVGAAMLRRQSALFLWVLAASVACWWAGNVVWLLTGDPFSAVPWWLAFVILTIAAERLELTRVRPLPRSASALFCGIASLLPAAATLAPWQPLPALRLFGAGELLLALWLIRYDIARRTVRERGLTRFIAVCLLSGYGWLAVSGALGLDGALAPGHPAHDAALHALTLGFVFSMILGHTPIIVPAIARLRVAYRPFFYAPLALLHAAVALRVAGGLLDAFTLRRAGGEAAAVAIASFAVTLAIGIGLARQAKTRRDIGKRPL
ncbi:hypothetical protein [Burkholderia oklahomensis]|uniref:Membrane protein n=2 Tax=Burkholderia oklahomensis TaxID=342113 RepID=A0AAI8B7U8_9BURK|nr:hypothetical protein [Burkholderia oklahomensis]AIO67161.1 putative membrane protein [Burkholderia oklahomensis]AOI41835.1 hypothetical protein WG70_19440 [Burkholderia oklahomensis EO147]KUY67548.1 hypothetical protein WG70_03695 [Burkholderia oklahomensis EO147]QPS36575.1 hypothetical protein I6G57_14775 [Burkholderia oklahomensis]